MVSSPIESAARNERLYRLLECSSDGICEVDAEGRCTYSTRVGAGQDLAELDIDLAAITQAGGWKSTRMPLKYAEKINAARSGMARAAAATGRDKAVSE
jgi:hypothetical protein